MLEKITKGTWESLLFSVAKSYKVNPKRMKLERRSDEPIVAMRIETLKLYLCEGALL